MNETIWEFLKPRWHITKKKLKDIIFNPDNLWINITLGELYAIAGELEITVAELIER